MTSKLTVAEAIERKIDFKVMIEGQSTLGRLRNMLGLDKLIYIVVYGSQTYPEGNEPPIGLFVQSDAQVMGIPEAVFDDVPEQPKISHDPVVDGMARFAEKIHPRPTVFEETENILAEMHGKISYLVGEVMRKDKKIEELERELLECQQGRRSNEH